MKTKKMMSVFIKINTYGFTLVELIVVISILVILGTIGFMSLSGYSSNARDSSRLSDLTNLRKALELTYQKTNTYPTPSNGIGVTFSGGTIWMQGSIGDSVITQVNSAGFKLSKKPTDSKYPNIEYTYSLLENKKEYQLGMITENPTAYNSPNTQGIPGVINTTYAAEDTFIAYIGGNYNGLITKVQTGTTTVTTYYLALPSIILGDLSNTELSVPATQSGNLVLHKKGNIPSSYTSNGIKTSITNNFNYSLLSTSTGIIVYSTTAPSLDSTGATALMNALYNTYSGSNLKGDTIAASQVVSLITGGTGALLDVYNGIVSKSIEESAVSSTATILALPVTAYSGATIYTPMQQFIYNSSTVTVSGVGVGISSLSAYPSCGNDIVIWSGANIQIWAACNAGANTRYDSAVHDSPIYSWSGGEIDATIEANRITAYSGVINSSTNFLGNYYQWGRNDPVNLLATGSNQYNSTYQTGGVTLSSGSGFILGIANNYSWVNDTNHNTSSGIIWTNATNNGPCPSGYHIPTGGTFDITTDWGAAYVIAGDIITLRSLLSIPLPGFRFVTTGAFKNQGLTSYYWSSSKYPNDTIGRIFCTYFSSSSGGVNYTVNRSTGISLRCLKN